ncbi:AP-4 complex accessory subunit RUSC1 [Tiliqua scincoides]|uniref:AP-4 complex accessory subunit RUSC1 n=1 Tax=Tiliqua scincoides TaxID=71010 RepID=UPI00346285B3
MQSPKKSWVCNLNHVHLQHVSLGLHLSRHPELQEDGNPLAPGRQAGCRDCRDHGGGTLEEVDANSNNPSLPCRCCHSHLLRLDDKLGLRGQPLLPSCPVLKNEEEEQEDLGSPSDPVSSSVSSCSDLSLDDSPVSVYFKELPTVEASSPDHQPNIVPLEDARYVTPLVNCGETGSNLNVPTGERPTPCVRDSPDSLCSSGSLGSPSDSSSPCPESPVEPRPAGSRTALLLVLPPTRPCRAPPAVPAPRAGTELDSNCNTLPVRETERENSSSSGQLDVNLNRAWVASGPPPVPPRTKRGLLGLRRGEAGKPSPAVGPPPMPSEPSLGRSYQPGEGVRKNVTSFHELAQKRKRATAGPPPPAPQARKDQSDWLIVFSPDTELPPCNKLTCGGAPIPETADPPSSLQEPGDPAGCAQRGVTTFKELRYRKQKGPLAAKGGAPPPPPTDPAKGVPDSSAPQELDLELPSNGHFWAPKEIQPRRNKPRPGLQPIVEGGLEETEDGGLEPNPSARSLEGTSRRRDPWVPGRGDRCEGRSVPLRSSQPDALPFQPLLFHISVVDGQPARSPHLSLCPSLESVELTSPAASGPAFCPRLETLSCEEVCLLADKQGQVLGTLSPEELLPIRLSPIGAYSPPARSVLPFLESPDLAVLFSPLFPRSQTFPALAFPTRQVTQQLFGAPGPLDSQAGAGPGRVYRDKMGTNESGLPKPIRQSQSFGGVPSAGRPWRAGADPVSAQLREQKKALLVAVSASVDKIVAHFSTAKNLVQKAQLGDSRLSPDVGYLVLHTLCPALRALVADGLKPFQKDVITGQRPSSPWSVVEASAKPGPHARSLNALYWRVSRLAPLRNNQQRFHAFVLGLLNMKQLELWFSHLQRNSELISALYLPTSFLVLSQGFCRRWAEELLLLLQPLSMLTFQLDLLFEYHHLSLDVRPVTQQAATPTQPSAGSWKARGPSCPDLAGRQASLEDGPLAQSSPLHEPQAGVPLHQRLLLWGDRLTHTLLGNEAPSKGESGPPAPQQEVEDKRSWWEQISRASEVYINAFPSPSTQEVFPVTRWARLRVALGDAVKEVCVGAGQAAVSSSVQPQPPNPEESGPETPRPAPSSRMGRSPEGQATQEPEGSVPGPETAPQADKEQSETPDRGGTPGSGKGTWLGWLFGANSPGASGCSPDSDSGVPRSRRPSSWLPPTMNVLALMMKSAPVEKSWPEESWEDASPDPLQPYRAVRALCDHAGTGDDHLSFRKGDILQVLDTVDEDWIQCCRGDSQGLVPVSYTSLIL